MTKPGVFMYSGQGAQSYHMASELMQHERIFVDCMIRLDDICVNHSGYSVLDHLYDDSQSRTKSFDQIRFTHPAIFMIEYSLTQLLMGKGIHPHCVLGASLGEFVACAVAGVLTLDSALKAVLQQAEIISRHCRQGVMLAALAPAETYYKTPLLYQNSTLAGINSKAHFVLSMKEDVFPEIDKYFASKNIPSRQLPVRYAFHSDLISESESEFISCLQALSFTKPCIPYVSCASSVYCNEITPDHLWNAVREPICVMASMAMMEGHGAFRYIDVGPSGTMANFAKANIDGSSYSTSHTVLNPFGGEKRMLDNLVTSSRN